MKIIYDLETNGLIPEVSNIWIAVCKNIETNEITTFSDHDKDSKPLNELLPFLNKCEILIGHNIINYDNVDRRLRTKKRFQRKWKAIIKKNADQ